MADFPWIKHYPEGISPALSEYEYTSLIAWFDDRCSTYRDRVAFENFGRAMRFDELHRQATRFAAYLQGELGLKKGERIALQLPNLLQFPVAFFGAIKAGLIVVNTNPLYTAREMKHQFCDAGVSAVVILANFAHHLEKIQDEIPARHIIVTRMGDMIGGIKGHLMNVVVKYVKKLVPPFHLPKAVSFKTALQRGGELTYRPPEMDIEDVAVLQYTGGTTGVAKGAQLSHRNLIAHDQIITSWFTPYRRKPENVVITALPLYHIFALTVNGLMMMSEGAKNVLITNPRDMPGFIKELRRHRFTIITGVNTLFNGMMMHPDFKDLDFSTLKGGVAGGMAVQDSVAEQWESITGTPMIEGYGLSETSPVLCCNPLEGNHRKGSVGVPMPGTEVATFDEAGNRLPEGEVGEICARGPQVMRGYWQKSVEGVFFPGGWFRTGDIGSMDKDGFFRLIDRKKDVIIVSGFNVYPNEIENVVAGHSKVMEVAAIGIPHKKSGEAVKLFVVKKDPSLTEEELIAFCSSQLTRYKTPKQVEFVDEMPKSNVGKVLRRILKERETTNTPQ